MNTLKNAFVLIVLGAALTNGGMAHASDVGYDGVKTTRHGVVTSSTVPSCKVEDASSGPLPCSWNIEEGDGNSRGLSYYVTGTHKHPSFHYVWMTSPLAGHPGRQWIKGQHGEHMNRQCWVRFGSRTTAVGCADGFRYSDYS